jgi:hypothetical protein
VTTKRQPPMCKFCLRDEAQHVPGWYCAKFTPRQGRGKLLRTAATMQDIRVLIGYALRQAADLIERGDGDGVRGALADVSVAVDRATAQSPPTRPARKPVPAPAPAPDPDEKKNGLRPLGGIGVCERKILTVLAGRVGKKTSALQCALLSGYKMSGSFASALTNLRAAEYITGPNASLALTPEGTEKAGGVAVLLPGSPALAFWKGELGECRGRILGVLVSEYPDEVDVEALAQRTSYKPSGSFAEALTDLRKFGVIERGRGRARASHEAVEVLKVLQ